MTDSIVEFVDELPKPPVPWENRLLVELKAQPGCWGRIPGSTILNTRWRREILEKMGCEVHIAATEQFQLVLFARWPEEAAPSAEAGQ